MKKNRDKWIVYSSALVATMAFVLWISLLAVPSNNAALGAAINQTLNTTVNITNARPEVRTVTLSSPIDLEAYGNKSITCNATVFDWDNETLVINATLYINGSTNPESTDDGNNKYSNTNCTLLGSQNRLMNYSCTFEMKFYADNSSQWMCNVTAKDGNSKLHSNLSTTSIVNPLVAIYVPGVLDFGNLEVDETSGDKLANITNAGNRNVTIYVQSWGSTKGDSLAMNCTYGSIANSWMKYNLSSGQVYDTSMKAVTNSDVLIDGLTVYHRSNETVDSTNSTAWKLKIPPFAGGICNGKLLFTAEDTGV